MGIEFIDTDRFFHAPDPLDVMEMGRLVYRLSYGREPSPDILTRFTALSNNMVVGIEPQWILESRPDLADDRSLTAVVNNDYKRYFQHTFQQYYETLGYLFAFGYLIGLLADIRSFHKNDLQGDLYIDPSGWFLRTISDTALRAELPQTQLRSIVEMAFKGVSDGGELSEELEAYWVIVRNWAESREVMRRFAESKHSIFPTTPKSIIPDLCFVLMPFDPAFDEVWQDVIKVAVGSALLRPVRADDLYGPRPVMQDIWEQIVQSRVLIADLTGRNANVFYELGLAHALNKNVVLLTQNLDDVPFDLRHLRVVKYTTTGRGLKELETALANNLMAVVGMRWETRGP